MAEVAEKYDPIYNLTSIKGFSLSYIQEFHRKHGVSFEEMDKSWKHVSEYNSSDLGQDESMDDATFVVQTHEGVSPPPEADVALKLICMADVQREMVQFLWDPFIPLGKITILQGDPGLGKTFLAVSIASVVTNGGAFPTGDNGVNEPANVIIQTAEDGLADTIKARLEDSGADCRRVFVVDESENVLTLNDERLGEAIRRIRAKLLVIDPIQAYIGADRDFHRANETRPLMAKLGHLAEATGCAVLLIGHLSKAAGVKGLYRGLGSIDIAAAARSVLTVGEVPEQKYRRAVVHMKSNLAPQGETILFDLDPARGFLWAGTSDLTVDEVLNYKPERSAPEHDDCAEFLKQLLLAGPRSADEAKSIAITNGFSLSTIERAKKRAGIRSVKTDGGRYGAWLWTLGECYSRSSQDERRVLDDVDHLVTSSQSTLSTLPCFFCEDIGEPEKTLRGRL